MYTVQVSFNIFYFTIVLRFHLFFLYIISSFYLLICLFSMFLSIQFFTFLFFYLIIFLSFYLSIFLFFYFSIFLFFFLFFYLFIFLFFYLSIFLSFYFYSFYLSVFYFLSICLIVFIFICLSTQSIGISTHKSKEKTTFTWGGVGIRHIFYLNVNGLEVRVFFTVLGRSSSFLLILYGENQMTLEWEDDFSTQVMTLNSPMDR